MTGHWTSQVVLWLADVYVMSSLLLLLALAACAILGQPARRMTVARAAALGLAVLAILSAIPGWPRHSWGTSWLPEEEKAVSSPARSSPTIADGGAGMPARSHSLAVPSFAPTSSSPVRAVSLAENPDPGRAGAEPAAAPMPVAASPVAVKPSWTAVIVAAYCGGSLLSLAWLLVGAVQAAFLCRRSHAAPASLLALLRANLSVRHRALRIRLSRRIAHPVALGVLRPMILLPERFVASESEDRVRTALAHELAHIGNGDLGLLALCRLLLPLFHAQPLFWLLRRQIRLDQEVLADAAAASSDRTRYAEILLDWARTMAARPADSYAAALGLWERPTQLRRRIAVLLDTELRVEPRCPRAWKLGAWCFALLIALLLSFATLHPARGLTESPPVENSKLAVASDQVVFQGRVVDPEGKPYAGARIYFGDYWETDDSKPAALRATSGPDGRYRISVDRAYFHHLQGGSEPWNDVRLIAVAPGFGLGLSDSKEPDANHDATLRLVLDHAPITGRLIDLEGRPVASAVIRVGDVSAPPTGNLDGWVQEAKAGKERGIVLEWKLLPVMVYLGEQGSIIAHVRTDQEGRFRIKGVGSERLAGLLIDGPTIRAMRVKVMTRSGSPLRARGDENLPKTSFETYHAATLVVTAAPGRVVEGTALGMDTGEPIIGAVVTGANRRVGDFGDARLLRTRTDDAGHFQLRGMPSEAGGDVGVFPQNQPFFGTLAKLPDRPGDEPIRLDLNLRRGLVAEGKVTDKVTGKPVLAVVRYDPAADNPHIAALPGYRELAAEGSSPTWRETLKDGSFRIPVLPGRGVLIVAHAGS